MTTISKSTNTSNDEKSAISNTPRSKRRVTLFINPALSRHARAQAVVEELTLTALVEKALTAYLPKETVIRKAEIQQ